MHPPCRVELDYGERQQLESLAARGTWAVRRAKVAQMSTSTMCRSMPAARSNSWSASRLASVSPAFRAS